MQKTLRITRCVAKAYDAAMRLLAPTLMLGALFASFVETNARADERPARLTDRSGLVVSFEQLFGIADETIGRREYGITNIGVGSTFGPRLGAHGLIRGGFTAGGIVGSVFFFRREKLDDGFIVLGPRVGWMLTSDVIGVWPRIGLDFVLGDVGLATSFAADLPLTIRLTRHSGILIGPGMDVPTSNAKPRERYRVYSFTAGLFGAF